MYIHGQFLTQLGETVSVYILTNNDRTEEVEIGGDDERLFFTDEPCEIESAVNDTFDVLLCQSATIRLYAKEYIADFFCKSCRDAIVNIYKGEQCVFAGFIEPQSYSQGYNEQYDEVELNCIDALSALQYSNYKNIGAASVLYSVVKAEAGTRTFYDILSEILDGVTDGLCINGDATPTYYYDGSKAINVGSRYTAFKDIAISELLFLGDEEDDVWTQETVVEELLKFLNLHVVQDGFKFFIFDWQSVKGSSTIYWKTIDGSAGFDTARSTKTITADMVADADTKISVGEVYNQLLLTCDIEKEDTIIESPLDDDYISSDYNDGLGWQKYCTEISTAGEGKTSINAFYNLTHDGTTTYDGGDITDWYLHLMKSALWNFYASGKVDLLAKFDTASGKYQDKPLDYLAHNLGCALIAFGKNEMNTAHDDNSPVSSIDMTNYLVISVNGNEVDNDENNTYPGVSDLKGMIPCAEYLGNTAGGEFSPVDDDTTNYIVLSGKILLNPIVKMTDNYKTLHDGHGWTLAMVEGSYWHKTVNAADSGNRYYTRKYWTAETPKDDPTWDDDASGGLIPPLTGNGFQSYEFKYSAIGESSDTISKVAVLACMLVIGDKCVVETGTQGQVSDFAWKTYKTLDECTDEDEYYQQCFYIGFDPKIGDKLIGTEFDFQNNIDYTMGVDAEGIAIPIKKSDKVSGQIKFQILGPVNLTWDEITRRHPTMFRHTKWSSTTVPLLAHVSSIMLKEFECKIYSDNGLLSGYDDDNDVVYMSDTVESFVNKKDDLEFKINSMLTSSECKLLGVSNGVKLSAPINATTKDGISQIRDAYQSVSAKAEQLYVDAYYNEYHLPRVIMEQNVMDKDSNVGLFTHYKHEAIGKEFFVQGIGRNLIEGSASLTLKEVDND